MSRLASATRLRTPLFAPFPHSKKFGRAMHGIVRFIDTPLLPASAPEDFPKIIHSGIDEEGQDKQSPAITGPDGAVTLLHQLGRPELIERFLDIEGTMAFMLTTHASGGFHNAYIKRMGTYLEIGLLDSEGESDPCVVFKIEKPDPAYPWPGKTGRWVPNIAYARFMMHGVEKEDIVRFQGGIFTKAIWWHKHYKFPVSVDWSGTTSEKRDELKKWDEERRGGLKRD